MVKLFFLCRRRPDLTHARYAELLLTGHVPIALHHHPTLRRYTVNIVEANPPGAEELDSIGELSFATLADYRERLYDSPEGERIVHRDVAGFMGGAHAYATTEHVRKAGTGRPLGARAPGVKLICPLRRRPDLTHAAFVAQWLARCAPEALDGHPDLIRYVADVVDQNLSDRGDEWDGFAEVTFAGAADERIIRNDLASCLGSTVAYRVAEYVQRE